MTRVGAYTFTKTPAGFVLADAAGKPVGKPFPTAKAANAKGLALTAAAYKARSSK